MQAENSTISPLATHNASIASLLPQNATQNVGKNNSGTLLIADPSWGAAIVVNASNLHATQLVVSNTTSAGSTTVFTTVYNTTTVSCFSKACCVIAVVTVSSSSTGLTFSFAI